MIETIDKNKCTGCKMCADICPPNAISFKVDKTGFWYPTVNGNCIECGLCVKKCPSLNDNSRVGFNPTVYAAWSNNHQTRITSTSGGLFWTIAEEYIKKDGVVVGSRYRSDWKSAEHSIATNMDELLKIKGSKYFQSDTVGIYKKVKNILDEGKEVLFCGTPCQMAALNSYLGRRYKNLVMMDFICRSVNSPKAFKAYLDELEAKYESKVSKVHLKHKQTGWQSLASHVCFENGQTSHKDRNNDWWLKGFLQNDFYTRPSCTNCKYKVLPRVNADITIGDFWGIKNQSQDDMFNGISVVFINTKKGEELFDSIKDKLKYEERSLTEALNGNPALLKNPTLSNQQMRFFELLDTKPFSEAVKECVGNTKKQDIIQKVFRKSKKMIKILLKSKEISLSKYIKYNYLSKNVIRKSNTCIIPYKGTVIDFSKDSKIMLSGNNNLVLNCNKLRKSKSECRVRMGNGAIWNCNNGANIFYDTTIEIKDNAVLNTGYFSINSGCVIIAQDEINFGEDVMLGRNITIYDSDFHSILTPKGLAANQTKPVNIGDHVWLTNNVVVNRGSKIGFDSMISSYATVEGEIPPHSIVRHGKVAVNNTNRINWDRNGCPVRNKGN